MGKPKMPSLEKRPKTACHLTINVKSINKKDQNMRFLGSEKGSSMSQSTLATSNGDHLLLKLIPALKLRRQPKTNSPKDLYI